MWLGMTLMKNILKKSSPLLLALPLLSNAALADETYIGLNYDLVHYSELFVEKDSISLNGVSLSLGHMFNKRWGIETKFGAGFNTKETEFDSDLIRFRVDHYASVLAVTKFSFTNNFSGAIKWGLTRSEVTQTKKVGIDWQDYRTEERSGLIGASVLWAMDYKFTDASAVDFEVGILSNRAVRNLYGIRLGVKTNF